MSESVSTSWFRGGLRRIGRATALLAVLGLAACENYRVADGAAAQQGPVIHTPGGIPAPLDQQVLTPAPPSDDKVRVGLLLPLSGGNEKLGEAMLNAAQLAVFEIADDRLALLVQDTGATPDGARRAAETAIGQGAQLVLGPLFAAQAAAAGPAARAAGVPLVSFSTDLGVAGDGVWVMGILPRIQVQRVVGYTASQGRRRVAALAPANAYGDAVVNALYQTSQRTGANVSAVQRYEPEATDLSPIVTGLGRDFDAVMIPEGGNRVRLLAPLLAYHDIDPAQVKFLGTALWDDPSLGQEQTLVGGWFAAPDPGPWAEFSQRYRDAYGEAPPRLASIAYDATALAAVLARSASGVDFSPATLTQANGFAGVDGIFRLLPDGSVERGLAVLEVRREGPVVIDPAPRTFEELGF